MTYNKNAKIVKVQDAQMNKNLIGDTLKIKVIRNKRIDPDPGNGERKSHRPSLRELVEQLVVDMSSVKQNIADIGTRLDQNNLKPLVRSSK